MPDWSESWTSSRDSCCVHGGSGCTDYLHVSKTAVKQMYRRRARGIRLVKGRQTFTAQPTGRRFFPFFPHSDDVSNWPFLFPFPSSFIIPSSPAPLRASPSFVLMFEFSLADRLSQIISFNSPCGTKTHSPCNFLIILFPFEAPECRSVRCQL